MFTLIIAFVIAPFLSSPNYDDAKYLTTYLEERGIIPQPEMFYVVISRNSCIYCSQYSKDVIEHISNCSNMVVITGDEDILVQVSDGHNMQVVFDEAFDFDYLPYDLAGTNIIKIVGDKLQIQEFDTDNIHELKSTLANNCSKDG